MLVTIPLGDLAVALPILAGGAGLMLFAVFLALFMPETRFAPVRPENRNTFQHMGDIFRKGFATARARPALTAVLGVGFIYGLYSEGWDRLWVKSLVICAFSFSRFCSQSGAGCFRHRASLFRL